MLVVVAVVDKYGRVVGVYIGTRVTGATHNSFPYYAHKIRTPETQKLQERKPHHLKFP